MHFCCTRRAFGYSELLRDLVPSSQSDSSPHSSIFSLCSLLRLTLWLSFYSLPSHVNVSGVYLLCLGCGGLEYFLQTLLSLLYNINVYYRHRSQQTNPVSMFFICPPLLSPLRVCVCVVCGSYSMSESWNGDHRLDQGRNSNTL